MKENKENNKINVSIKLTDDLYNSESVDVSDVRCEKGIIIENNTHFEDTVFIKLTDNVSFNIPVDKFEEFKNILSI